MPINKLRLPLRGILIPLEQQNNFRRCGMTGTITFSEDLTIDRIGECINDLRNAMDRWDEVRVDAGDVRTVDVAAIQMLIAARKECEGNGRKISLNKSDAMKRLLSSIGVEL
jgi:anti-anti-sigma regulatory factor